eukprot:COSAG03_NODE_12396_length_549_cov_0.804444_2_plen_127_part_01
MCDPDSVDRIIDRYCGFSECVVVCAPLWWQCSYNAVNMTPTCLSPLLRQARIEWGFEQNGGYVTSDTDAVGDAYRAHHFVDSAAAASCEAITKGGDQVNSGGTFSAGLLDGVKQGLCSMDDVDAALT